MNRNYEIPRTALSATEFAARTDIAHAGNCRGNADVFQRIAISGVTLENKNITRCEFQYSSFTDVTFSGVNFEGAEFDFAVFERVQFISCNLNRSSFDFSQMTGVTFQNCNLTSSSFDFASGKISIENSILQGTEFHHTAAALQLNGCSGERVELNFCPALHIRAENCDFHRGCFVDSTFFGTMARCIFTDADFYGSNGENLEFEECSMREINTEDSTGILIKNGDEDDDFDLDFD